jgi:niacin transporter
MPPAAYLAPMMLELAVYGLTAGLMMRLIRVKKLYVRLYLSLLTAMLLGRVVAGAAAALIFTPGQYTMAAWVASYFVKCLPAIVLQLTVVPAIYLALQRARAISPIPVAK